MMMMAIEAIYRYIEVIASIAPIEKLPKPQKNQMKTLQAMKIVAALSLAAGHAMAEPTKVLMVTGDWKTQEWYQNWMTKPGEEVKLYRGRLIAREVEKAAPGQFEFTDVTNYTGQEYLDADWLSQFDVLLLGDIMGLSLNPRFLAAVEDFVKDGGGLVYCASHKWRSSAQKNTPFANALPGVMPVDAWTEDWRDEEKFPQLADNAPFTPRVAAGKSDHPIVKGLDWAGVPELNINFKITPKDGAEAVLESPAGNPVLTVWQPGKGRAALSTSIYANDEVSPKFGDWPDFGKYYANLFRWLGENATAKKTPLRDAKGAVTVAVDFNKTANTVTGAMFGLHGAHDCPGFSPLKDKALENYKALNLAGAFGRFDVKGRKNRDDDDYAATDRTLGLLEGLDLVPMALFNHFKSGNSWVWEGAEGASWHNPNEKNIANVIFEIDAFLAHTNGKKGSPGYRPRVPYIELLNEPDLTDRTIPGFAKLFNAVADHVHENFPGVKVGAWGSYEMPYLEQFIEQCGAKADWISRHPYGWTGEMVFTLNQKFEEWAKARGHDHLKFIITEWDFWIMGRQKFDYMVRRNFEAVKHTDSVLGTLHYRLGYYPEPIYLFGVLWNGSNREKGGGEWGEPMHDAYDAFWIFRDFRGARAAVETSADNAKLAARVHADATVDGAKHNVVLYYDWAYGGDGFKDYEKGVRHPSVEATVNLSFVAGETTLPRTMTISKATGEGFEVVRQGVPVPAGDKHTLTLELEPLTAYSITVSPGQP